jgi:hypothetical protein
MFYGDCNNCDPSPPRSISRPDVKYVPTFHTTTNHTLTYGSAVEGASYNDIPLVSMDFELLLDLVVASSNA